MLSINWEDVFKILNNLKPQLIFLGIVILLALIVTVAVRKRITSTRKFSRTTIWVAAGLAAVVAANMMVYGGLKNVLDLASGKGVLTQGTIDRVEALGNQIADESMVLLKNSNATLPLAGKSKLNVLGWASTNPVYGGTGSGSLSDDYPTTSLLEGLAAAEFETNKELSDFYTAFRAERPTVGMFEADWSLPEPLVENYPAELVNNAKAFSDTALVTISRSGGEGFDLPQNVNAEISAIKAFSYTNNSESRPDFEDGQGYLSLTNPEKDVIKLAKENFEKVIVIYNGANAFELAELENDPEIDAIVWAIPPGQVGFNALGRILDGEVNPSAKTPDTFVTKIANSPIAKNFGKLDYTNMDEFKQTSVLTKEETVPAFVNYNEGIYVGYRWYETAAAEGIINYDEEVVYPFGYGLSYTTFKQEMGPITRADGKVSFDVTVTNIGSVAGKDVVEVYSNPPYTNGGIEKSAVNLVAFEKTGKLEPGASETISVSFDESTLASYDEKNAKAYVLEAGDYKLSIRTDSHNVIAENTLTIDQTITYNSENNTHAGDKVVATNQFDSANGGFTYLSRADKFANYAQATAAPASYEISAEHKAGFIANQNYKPEEHNNDADQMPVTGADNGLVLGDLAGVDYDDPKWDKLLDQLSVEDMDKLSASAGYGSVAIPSVGKLRVSDVDGPAALNNNFTGVGSIGLPVSVSVAATWSKDIAKAFGDAIADMAHEINVAGWYAPAMNIHRSPYSGRNFEYFSEDPHLAGVQAALETQGVQTKGVYAFIKHFALNDQETNRLNMLVTWANEQSIREIYLRPFELAVKEGQASAVMSAFNYIGTVYAGAHPELLNNVLRDEWGFRGMVLTDFFGSYGYQNADQIVRGGGDAMLAPFDSTNHVQDKSATSILALRQAAKNILYTVANSWIYENGQPEEVRPVWEYVAWVLSALAIGLLVFAEFVGVKRFRARRDQEKLIAATQAEAEVPAEVRCESDSSVTAVHSDS